MSDLHDRDNRASFTLELDAMLAAVFLSGRRLTRDILATAEQPVIGRGGTSAYEAHCADRLDPFNLVPRMSR